MNFTAFFSYVVLGSFTPGPNNIMAMTNAGKYGFKKAMRFNIGVFFGFVTIMGICAVFSALLYDFIPSVKPVMLCIGAAYILWLAWTIWRDKPHEKKGRVIQTNTVASGIILQFVNVKMILYGITVMSSFILPHYQSPPVIAAFAVGLALVGLLTTVCWALCGAAFQKIFQEHSKLLNAIMALLLVYCAVTMIMDIWA